MYWKSGKSLQPVITIVASNIHVTTAESDHVTAIYESLHEPRPYGVVDVQSYFHSIVALELNESALNRCPCVLIGKRKKQEECASIAIR